MSLLAAHHGAIFQCPLCDWKLEVAPVYIIGRGVIPMTANYSRHERIERDLHDHLSQHSLVDWVKKVRELENRIADLTRID